MMITASNCNANTVVLWVSMLIGDKHKLQMCIKDRQIDKMFEVWYEGDVYGGATN